MQYTFVIDGRLAGLNEMTSANRANMFAGAGLKKKETHRCILAAKIARLPKIKNPVSVSIAWVEPNSKRDLDNIAAGTKFIFDGLVECEVLPNDTRQWIRSIVHHFPDPDKDKPRVIVTLTEIAEEKAA